MSFEKAALSLALAIGILASLSASAYAANPVLTSPAETAYEGTLDLSATKSLRLYTGPFEGICTESTIAANIITNEEGIAGGPITTRTFGECNATTDVLANGALEVRSGGSVYLKEDLVTWEKFGISCIYGGGTGTQIGTLEGSALSIEAAMPKQSGSAFLCASTAEMTGEYAVTAPEELEVD